MNRIVGFYKLAMCQPNSNHKNLAFTQIKV